MILKNFSRFIGTRGETLIDRRLVNQETDPDLRKGVTSIFHSEGQLQD